jgi:S1-C subfamily serine protease
MIKYLLPFLLLACNHHDPITNMMDSVAIVQQSSGIVVYSDADFSLVLTALHVIADDERFTVSFLYLNGGPTRVFDAYIDDLDVDNDLALLRLNPGFKLAYSKVARVDPKLGDDVWIAANPNFNYRSLKKGIVSSKDRPFTWELSGGVIFGSSGGGAFNLNGELIGIAHSVDSYAMPGSCTKKGKCLQASLPDFGFFVPPDVIRAFLTNGIYGDAGYFDYLKEVKHGW